MTVTINNNYPIFEADQVLTADHLNDSFEYLEEQQRLTRIKLIGMGIVCGLEARLAEANTIVSVSTGVAITSKGYLITFKGDAPEGLINYPFFTPYSDPNEDVYPFFLSGGNPIPLFELQEQRIEGAEPLSELADPISSYGLLMYLECFDKKLKNCIENDCNEKGTERIFTLRVLLVRKEDLRNVICMEEALNGPKTEAQLERIVNARFQLNGLQIPRIRLLPNLVNYPQFITLYQQIISVALPDVQKALLASYRYFRPVLLDLYKGRTDFEQMVVSRLPAISAKITQANICYVQYLYDLLCDLTEAYNEFMEEAFDLWTECCPSMERFPKHIRLGGLRAAETCEPSLYRTRFLHSPIHNGQGAALERVKCLHLKMAILIEQFQGGGALEEIRITPSREVDNRLSLRAIPAYYQIDEALLKYWNPELKRKCRYRENLSYHAALYASMTHVIRPLGYSLKNYDFFRIEGHLCRPYPLALREILRLRALHNLPFDVVALKLGGDAGGTEVEDVECIFQDLEIICRAWKEEMACLLSNTMRGVTTLRPADAYSAEGLDVTLEYNATPNRISVVEAVKDSIQTESGSLGTYVIQGLNQEAEDLCVNRDISVNILQGELAELEPTQTENQLNVDYPTTIAFHILEYATVIDRNCSDLDIDALQQAHNRLLRSAHVYHNALTNYQSVSNRNFTFNASAMLRVMSIIISSCSLERMRVIKAEIERRKEKLRQMNLFSEYLKKNPGMDHQAGVPKGGTFIMVYTGNENETNGLVPEGTVIADFFLPYLCCSDCPPIAYILPETETGGGVDLRIKVSDYCVPYDSTIYPFEVEPPDGEVSGEGVVQNEAGQYVFEPNQVDMGTEISRSLTFQVNGRETSLVINLEKTPDINFSCEIIWEADDLGVRIPVLYLKNEAFDDRYTYEWFLRILDPQTGDEVNWPGNPIAGDEAEARVVLAGVARTAIVRIALTGRGENCAASDTKEQEIPPPQVDPVDLSISQTDFCTPYRATLLPFVVSPANGQLSGEGVVFDAANGQYFFDPNQVNMETQIRRSLNFLVNGQETSLTITVERTAELNFSCGVVWEITADGNRVPVIQLINEAFDDRYKYEWKLVVFDPQTGASRDWPENPIPGNQADTSVALIDVAPGSIIRVGLSGIGENCSVSDLKEEEVPPPPQEIDLSVFISDDGPSPVTLRRFSNQDQNNYIIRATPGGGELLLNDDPAAVEAFFFNIVKASDRNDYFWTPLRKEPGVYSFLYKHPDGETSLQLTIFQEQGPIDGAIILDQIEKVNTNLKELSATPLFQEYLSNSEAFFVTQDTAKRFSEEWRDEATFEAYQSGANDGFFGELMNRSTQETFDRLLANPSDETGRDVVLDLYKPQLDLAITFAAMLKDDLPAQNPVSKLFTVLKNQIKSLTAARIKTAHKLVFDEILSEVKPGLEGKEKTIKKIEQMLKQIR